MIWYNLFISLPDCLPGIKPGLSSIQVIRDGICLTHFRYFHGVVLDNRSKQAAKWGNSSQDK